MRNDHPYELVKGKLYSFDADVYLHHFSSDLVGYESKRGAYKVIEKDDLLGVVTADHPQEGLMSVDLLQDVGGEYFPVLSDPDKYYSIRRDGKVEEVTFDANSSTGRVVENVRGRIKKKEP
ncbi:MAG: hypothetical protein QGG48_04855 [Desulfatiglandales bacterium]|nr:hypothetical protein [Desulfatiglandales bacterium]